jgi:hypothetical protein
MKSHTEAEEMPENETPITRIERKLDRLLIWIYGNDETPGAAIRLDRLEQAEMHRQKQSDNRNTWLMTLFCGGGVTLAVAVWALIRSYH